jgi:protein-tyrosine phosphatase
MNLRDLGGWPTADGRPVAYGRLYRSDRLNELTDADLTRLTELGIVTVIDLRHESEAAQHPSRLWASVVQHRNIPMAGGLAAQQSLIERILAGELTSITVADVEASYCEMLTDHAAGFGSALELLLGSDGPALFHCTAGKDRTGLLAMLVLSSVGVSDDDVIRDFGLTNRYRAERRMAQLRPEFESRGLDIEAFRPALSAPEPALVAAVAWLRRSHGSIEAYLEGPAGVPDAGRRLRERLLNP